MNQREEYGLPPHKHPTATKYRISDYCILTFGYIYVDGLQTRVLDTVGCYVVQSITGLPWGMNSDTGPHTKSKLFARLCNKCDIDYWRVLSGNV